MSSSEAQASEVRTEFPRTVHSFVRRAGRITPGQRRAFESYMPRYGLKTSPDLFAFAEIFGRDAPVVLEIGFGDGDNLLSLAELNPHTDFLGIEVHNPGVGHLLKGIEDKGLTNLRVICEDAVTTLTINIPNASLNRVLLLFPDPWPKKRHFKRRIVQPEFIRLLASRIKPDGILHMATDWKPYGEHMVKVMQTSNQYINLATPEIYHSRPTDRMRTKFEQRGERLGHTVYDLKFKRVNQPP